MATQLLLYDHAVPVTVTRHRDWSIKTGSDYSFARRVNSVPLLLAEFQNACAEYAVVFTEAAGAVVPAVILGIRNGENLFVAEAGQWLGKYLPAFIRRYPFVFSSQDDGATFTLCIDEDFSGCNRDGRGERMFDSEGQRTQYLETMLGFLQAFQAEFQRTQAFCARLKELDLFEPMQARISLGSGQQVALEGFLSVSREKLNALAGDELESLAKAQALEQIYAQLFSLKNFSLMVEPANKTAQAADTAPAVADASTGEPE